MGRIRKKLTGAGKPRVAKRAKAKRGRRAVCKCVSRSGAPKVLFSERYLATRRAGDTMGLEGKMWQVYKCPSADGWHVSTVRWDPWKKSESDSQSRSGEES